MPDTVARQNCQIKVMQGALFIGRQWGAVRRLPRLPEPLSRPSAVHAASVTTKPCRPSHGSLHHSRSPHGPSHSTPPRSCWFLQSPGSRSLCLHPLPQTLQDRFLLLIPFASRTSPPPRSPPHYPNTLTLHAHRGPIFPFDFLKVHRIPRNDLIGLFIHLRVHYLSLSPGK